MNKKEEVLKEAITQAVANRKLPKERKVSLNLILKKARLEPYKFLGEIFLAEGETADEIFNEIKGAYGL
jgi:hypothetical protein